MADTLSKEKRSWNMSRIRAEDTSPEIKVRTYLHKQGFRFRLHRKDLPGKPDLVLPKYRTAIFIHGCFWHQHKNCRRANIPKTHLEYWAPKLDMNRKRDIRIRRALRSDGWKVIVLWECIVNNKNKSVKRLSAMTKEITAHRQRLART